MSANKLTVERYIDGFNRSDHAQILSCLSEDVEWLMPGTFHVTGRKHSTGKSKTMRSPAVLP